MLWSGKRCEIDRHEPCTHFVPLSSDLTFQLCAGSCVVQSECNSCSLLHDAMVNCGGSCTARVCPPAVHPCSSNPCLNGGSCSATLLDLFDHFAWFNCSCPPGWDGPTCESDVDECLSEPCQNGATCVDLIDAFECECSPSFSGSTCSIDQLSGYEDRECGPLSFFGTYSVKFVSGELRLIPCVLLPFLLLGVLTAVSVAVGAGSCDGACQPASCVHRVAQVDIGAPMPAIQSAIAAATFSSSLKIVAEGTHSGASAMPAAIVSILSAYGGCTLPTTGDVEQCVLTVESINQTVNGQVHLRGFVEDYNRPLVEHCYTNAFALDYTGNMDVTTSGRTCQRWDSQFPHAHTHCNQQDCTTDENYCRNPDSRALGAWCYTTDPAKRFENCDLGPPSSASLCNAFELNAKAQNVFERRMAQHVAAFSDGDRATATVLSVQQAAGVGRRRRLQAQMLGK